MESCYNVKNEKDNEAAKIISCDSKVPSENPIVHCLTEELKISSDNKVPSLENELQVCSSECRQLTSEDIKKLELQDKRGLVSNFMKHKLEQQAAVHWDKFYKRNETRFFKDRHWTTREFEELLGACDEGLSRCRSLLEIGCGVGNFFYPLLDSGVHLRVYACDFSPRAVELVKLQKCYNPDKIVAFVADVTQEGSMVGHVPASGVDLITCIFMLSAVSPDRHAAAAANIASVCYPGSVLLFRDYAVNDMAMIRFKPGSKIAERFYVRQDGTRAYYFTLEELVRLFSSVGFRSSDCRYVHRRTTNFKEGIDVGVRHTTPSQLARHTTPSQLADDTDEGTQGVGRSVVVLRPL
ncbi:S-adenosyl-L-methionine-dependent methyltransferase [Trinorchestia longiramus]|nr:S-adenosyl-L-methionine-dependent methyltransferase [Trinorchestia longiramus]